MIYLFIVCIILILSFVFSLLRVIRYYNNKNLDMTFKELERKIKRDEQEIS